MPAEKVICLGAHHHPDRRLVAEVIFLGDEGTHLIEVLLVSHHVKLSCRSGARRASRWIIRPARPGRAVESRRDRNGKCLPSREPA